MYLEIKLICFSTNMGEKVFRFDDDIVMDLEFGNACAYIALNSDGEQRYELQTGGTYCMNHPIVRGKLIVLEYDRYHEIIEELYSCVREDEIVNLDIARDILGKLGLCIDHSRHSEEGMIAILGYGGKAYLIYENSD